MTVKTPAKINWFLHILDKRDDGFHNILSSMQKISLFDSLTFNTADGILLHDGSGIRENIILKTIDILKKYRPENVQGVHIELSKKIPVSAGLGGGSSDAAATISALNTMCEMNLSDQEHFNAASAAGSDVPFFLGGNFSFVKGRGEIIEGNDIKQSYDILLINPGIKISAGWAYGHNDKYARIDDWKGLTKVFINAINKRDFAVLSDLMVNSLEKPVFSKYPEIKEIKYDLKQAGAKCSLMSGSGSTVFGVFEDAESACHAMNKFPKAWTKVVKTLS